MPIVNILRKNEPLLMYRRIEVYLNGKSIGYFPKGKSKEFDLPAGEHKIKAKTRWFGSREVKFTCFNKEKKTMVISTNKFLIRTLAILALFDVFLLIVGRNYQSEHKFISIFKTLAGVMFLIIVVYFFSIGRNNYLIIKEEGAD